MIGSTLEEEIADYIDANGNQVATDFIIFAETVIYEASYRFVLQRNEKRIEIMRETLSGAVNEGDSRSNKIVFMDYQRSDREN